MLEYNHDDHTVKLGSGLRLGHVLRELATNYNATLPTGICEWVGVGGHLQSSGLGPANKAVGLVMDLVIQFPLLKTLTMFLVRICVMVSGSVRFPNKNVRVSFLCLGPVELQ